MANKFMKKAVDEAANGVRKGDGGPFGAAIVRKGKIVASAHNIVLRTKDPTAHAEVTVIRLASKKLKRFDLSDCELYTSCEPCPMCLAAIYWARISKIYYGCTRHDAKKLGFDDKFFYDLIEGKTRKGKIAAKQLDRKDCLKIFRLWNKKQDKAHY